MPDKVQILGNADVLELSLEVSLCNLEAFYIMSVVWYYSAAPIFCVEIGDFQGLVGNFIELVDGLAKEVEGEKIRAIGARNHLKSIAKERDAQKQQLKALIAEKKMQLERYS